MSSGGASPGSPCPRRYRSHHLETSSTKSNQVIARGYVSRISACSKMSEECPIKMNASSIDFSEVGVGWNAYGNLLRGHYDAPFGSAAHESVSCIEFDSWRNSLTKVCVCYCHRCDHHQPSNLGLGGVGFAAVPHFGLVLILVRSLFSGPCFYWHLPRQPAYQWKYVSRWGHKNVCACVCMCARVCACVVFVSASTVLTSYQREYCMSVVAGHMCGCVSKGDSRRRGRQRC